MNEFILEINKNFQTTKEIATASNSVKVRG